MKVQPITLVLAALVLSNAAAAAPATDPPTAGPPVERVVWNKEPIRISLGVGIERRVTFPARIQMGPPRALTTKMQNLQSIDDTIYLTAKEPFDRTRMLVRECTVQVNQCVASGRTYLLELEASAEGGSDRPLRVFAPPASSTTVHPDSGEREPEPYTPVQLVRYAAQQLYAPTRLLGELPGVNRVPLRLNGPVALYQGGALDAKPEVSWSDGILYVTAVMLRNRTTVPQELDPRYLRGQWLSRTVIAGRTRLAPFGDKTHRDGAPVFLVSPRPFAETVQWQR